MEAPAAVRLPLRLRAYALVETVSSEDVDKRHIDAFDIFIIVLIFLNVLAVILESFRSLAGTFYQAFRFFEVFSVAVFTAEYIIRIWSCTVNPKYRHPILGRLRLATSPLAIIDLLAIIPFYLPLLLPIDLRFLRAIRLIRIFRVFKLGRYAESIRLFGRVLSARKAELVSSLVIISILLVLSSSLLYSVERDAQPDKFPNILAAMWWGVATLTTVGYGDVYPITGVGKLFGAIISILGIGFFALPTGILSAGFIDELRNKREMKHKCPHCGGELS